VANAAKRNGCVAIAITVLIIAAAVTFLMLMNSV